MFACGPKATIARRSDLCAAWRAFHASTSFTESSMICGPRARRSRFLLRGLGAPVLHFALVESHGGIARVVTSVSQR